MRNFSNKISLTKNYRGVYSLDTSIGCSHGMSLNEKGCYNDCYAARYSKKYGYDFSKTILRDFENETHKHIIIEKIRHINSEFLRIGTSGDPSENWEHTIKIIKQINMDYQLKLFKENKKIIVIITKHWNNLTTNQLKELSKNNVIINTSISAFDEKKLRNNRLKQYKKIKKYCKSILRIVSADFNLKNETGFKLNEIQKELFKNENTLDNILRLSNKNEYYTSGILNIKQVKFLGKKCYVSLYNENTHFGSCENCKEKCGVSYGGLRSRYNGNR